MNDESREKDERAAIGFQSCKVNKLQTSNYIDLTGESEDNGGGFQDNDENLNANSQSEVTFIHHKNLNMFEILMK